jgi:hypothetical protein
VNFTLRVMSPDGRTAALTPDQHRAVDSTIRAMMAGALSLKTANDAIIHKLETANLPVNFGEVPCTDSSSSSSPSSGSPSDSSSAS